MNTKIKQKRLHSGEQCIRFWIGECACSGCHGTKVVAGLMVVSVLVTRWEFRKQDYRAKRQLKVPKQEKFL